jgi:endonuclease/exonuclease/phosphatase family metal-dependent hydrolase
MAIGLISICSVAASASAQTTVTLSTPGTHINADLTIQGGSYSTVDFSASEVLASKVSSASYSRRIMLKFDTQNFIPANAIIQSAQLHLVLKTAESAENRPFTAYHVTKSFVTGQTTWLYHRTGQAWSTSGGDFGQTFGTTYVGNAVGSTYKFDLTQMVQKVVNGQFGSRYTRLALLDVGANTSGNYREFHSTRAADPAVRPRLVITYGTSSTATPPPTATPSTGNPLRVMQWNIHKTKGSDGVCNPDRIANVIVAQNVDVVSLNEVNFYSGACAWDFDMGARLQSLVQQKTGVTWYRQHVNANGGSSGVGNVILSRHQPVSSSSTLLSYTRGVAQMTIVVNGRPVNLFSTHVEYYESSWRPIQIAEAVRWMDTFSEPRIVMGDFNTWPGTSDYHLIANPYQDSWVAAQSAGTATAYNGTGATHGYSRFDYVFYSRVAALSLKSVNVLDTRVNGVYASDHDPVIAVFTVN